MTLLAAFTGLGGSSARAEDTTAIKKIEGMQRLAMEDYGLDDFAGAHKQLVLALTQAKAAKLEQHAVNGKTHLLIGVVHIAEKKDQDAIREFTTALTIDATATLPAQYTKTAGTAFDQVKAQVVPRKVEPVAADPNAPIVGIVHVPVDTAREGDTIAIEAKVGADVKAKKVLLAYRAAGARDYTALPMKNVGGTWKATIPAGGATGVDQVQYYLSAMNAKAKVVASRGNAATPFVIAIARIQQASETARTEEEEADDENPLLENNGNGKKKNK